MKIIKDSGERGAEKKWTFNQIETSSSQEIICLMLRTGNGVTGLSIEPIPDFLSWGRVYEYLVSFYAHCLGTLLLSSWKQFMTFLLYDQYSARSTLVVATDPAACLTPRVRYGVNFPISWFLNFAKSIWVGCLVISLATACLGLRPSLFPNFLILTKILNSLSQFKRHSWLLNLTKTMWDQSSQFKCQSWVLT